MPDIAQVTIRAPITTAVFGGGACSYSPIGTSQNSDGSASAVTLTTPALVTPPIQSNFTMTVYGTIIGIRWLRSTTTPAFNVIVDGEVFDIPIAKLTYNGMVPPGVPSDNEGHHFLPAEFDDGPHTVTVVLPAGPAAQALVIFGWLADKKHYSREAQPILDPVTVDVGTDPLAPTAKLPSSAAGANSFRGIGGIVYANDTPNTVVVRIVNQSGKTVWVKTIGPYDPAKCDLDDAQLVALHVNCIHYASAAGVTCTVFGGW